MGSFTKYIDNIIGHIAMGNFTLEQAAEKYPDIFGNILEAQRYSRGPEGNLDRISNAASTGRVIVEHLADTRNIIKLTDRRRIDGFGTVVPPPETNSSISTIIETQGSCDLAENYIHNSDDVEG